MIKKVALWAPYRGNIGTIKAVLNYANILTQIGYVVVFIELCDEWSSIPNVSEKYAVVSLTSYRIFNKIGKKNTFARRDFFAYQFFKVFRLRRTLAALEPTLLISFLGIVPALIAASSIDLPHWGSVQGFPRFLNSNAQRNFYFKIEDKLREILWRALYSRLNKILCMTPRTTTQLSNFLQRDVVFLPNPLFAPGDDGEINFDMNLPLDFVFIGRNSFQKRIDIVLQTFQVARERFPNSRLHFFGDIDRHIFLKEYSPYEILLERCFFHGFRSDLWSFIRCNLNPVHLVGSQWEDPGHAILEGINYLVPTLLVNSEGDYLSFYMAAGMRVFDCKSFQSDNFSEAIFSVSQLSYRTMLKDRLVPQFSVTYTESRLKDLLDV